MNRFIEVLKNVGGVKPCSYPQCSTKDGKPGRVDYVDDATSICSHCHGTGTVLDLAPLLAKPRCLIDPVSELIEKTEEWCVCGPISQKGQIYEAPQPLCVIGPQRAHSLVYEIARQLGGTMVTSQPYREGDDGHIFLNGVIPPDATALFVTDRVDEKEMMGIMQVTSSQPATALPYVLALVSSSDVWLNDPEGDKTNTWKVISLHQEKP